MANTKEIKNRIKSVQDTRKITNAMYLIASTKMQKAKKELDLTRPYFDEVRKEVKHIFRKIDNVNSIYFYPKTEVMDYEGTYGILVITADKGLAGAYNQNVLKETNRLIKAHDDV
ncbi:MAG: F0F1 ATP synthase subunit gamma, partial [Firmicutes bacterium]|nr:F0F1 ATP synthase subunit gamma [Bacillota bacterium]